MNPVLFVRIPEDMKAELDRLAAETGLTLTAVTVEVLSRGLTGASVSSIQRLHALLDRRRDAE